MIEKKTPKELAKIVAIFREGSKVETPESSNDAPPISDEKQKRKEATAEKMREIINKNKPWLKSTGAKTPEGKKRSSQNSYKHGRYSKPMKDLRRLVNDFKLKVKKDGQKEETT